MLHKSNFDLSLTNGSTSSFACAKSILENLSFNTALARIMELVNALNQAKAQGANITEKDLAAINAWQTATTPSSALNKAIAAVVNKVTSEGLLPAAGNILTGIGGR